MEKRFSYSEFIRLKNVAKNYYSAVKDAEPVRKKIMALRSEYESAMKDIEDAEEGFVKKIGLHVPDVFTKVIEPNGKTDKNGKPLKDTKYLTTDIVRYDEQHKEFVITIPDETPTPQPAVEVPTESEENNSEANDASFLDA